MLFHHARCPHTAGRWLAAHNQLCELWKCELWKQLLTACGFWDLQMEPRHWDDQLEEGEDNHRRPYILCRHPTNGQWYVIDVTVAWGGGGRWGVDYCKPGAASAHTEQPRSPLDYRDYKRLM
eukprot:SAG22_NODE_9_length_35992_cov_37.278104_11_plen_122_part_00